MGTQDKIGENEGIDSEVIEDVSFVPTEKDVENPEERSDAQRIADGDIEISTGDDEMFVSPDSIYAQKDETQDEKKGPEDEKKQIEKEPEKEPTEKKPEEKPAIDPMQKRVNKANSEKYYALRAKKKAEKENKELRKQLRESNIAKKKSELKSEKPELEDFETEAEYFEKLGRWGAKVEIHESESAKKVEEPVEKSTEDPRKRIIELGEEIYPDFQEKVFNIPITENMLNALVDSEYAHDILYDLGNNPEEAKRLEKIKSPAAIAREIGKIEARVAVPEIVEHKAGQDNEFIEKSRKKPGPSAPPPVKPLGGSGKVVKNQEDMTINEYYESRGYTRDGMKKSQVM